MSLRHKYDCCSIVIHYSIVFQLEFLHFARGYFFVLLHITLCRCKAIMLKPQKMEQDFTIIAI